MTANAGPGRLAVVEAGGFIDFLGVEIGYKLVPLAAGEPEATVFWATDTYLLVDLTDARAFDANNPQEGFYSYSFQDDSGVDIPGAFIINGVWLRNEAVPLTLPAFSTLSDAFVVTDHIEDPDLQKGWMTGLISNELVEGDTSEVGAKVRMVIKEGGKEVDEVINRIDTTEAAPPEELEEEEMPPLGDDAEE